MAIGTTGLGVLALITGSGGRTPVQALVPVPALPLDVQSRPELQLLAGASTGLASRGGKQPALITVPPSPLSSGTLAALQTSAQQLTIDEETVFEQAASAPQRELKRALAAVTRETTTSETETTTSTIEIPASTVTRTITEVVTVPGEESAGVQELRKLLEQAAARAGEAEELGSGRYSDRRVALLARSVEQRGDRLLDELDRALARGGAQLDRRAERALDRRGDSLVRAIDRLFDRGGERGATALDGILEENGARIVQTLGRVLEATGDGVSKALEDLLVEAGPRVIAALQETVDRVRPTTTATVTREVTEVIPGRTETITSSETRTNTTTSVTAAEVPPTTAEQRTAVRRQVEAYSTASNLLAPLVELSTPPTPVPNPAANIVREEREEKKNERGPIVVGDDDDDDDDQRTRPFGRSPISGQDAREITLRTPVAVERSGGDLSRVSVPSSSPSPAEARVDIAA